MILWCLIVFHPLTYIYIEQLCFLLPNENFIECCESEFSKYAKRVKKSRDTQHSHWIKTIVINLEFQYIIILFWAAYYLSV